jgi:hypothetical protein
MPRYKIRVVRFRREWIASSNREWMFLVAGVSEAPRWERGAYSPADSVAILTRRHPELFAPGVQTRIMFEVDRTDEQVRRANAAFFGENYGG